MYLYDGSLEGFYCCVFKAVYGSEFPMAIWHRDHPQPSLFPHEDVKTQGEEAKKVRSAIKNKISPDALELVETIYFSFMEEKEIHMLRFVLRAFETGPSIMRMMGDKDVAPLLKAQKHLLGEVHLLKGFIRFSDTGSALVSTITPKNFVLPFIAGHFTARYGGEDFMIYDKTHKAALIHQRGQAQIVQVENLEYPEASPVELGYRALWKQFYDTIAIEARINPKCRMTHMPKRYWENMIEMQDQF